VSAFVEATLGPELIALVHGVNRDPFAVLGPHADQNGDGVVVRAIQPAAESVAVRDVSSGELHPMTRRHPAGLFEIQLADRPDYRVQITFPDGRIVEIDDPYRYGQVLTDFDLHLLAEGTHYRAFEKLGAHRITVGTTTGVHFAVWAPNADRVSVIGDFNGWDGRVNPMRLLVPNGIWEIFIPDLEDGEKYKFEIRTRTGALLEKADPFAFCFEVPPRSASVVRDISRYQWQDHAWMVSRPGRGSWLERPMAIYEVHPGSWARVPEEGNRSPTPRWPIGWCRT
jgi:1,4-alpha-glucan branching enzyme